MFMWTSSSSGFHLNVPAVISFPILSNPAMMALASALVSTPIFSNIVAWVIEPRMSCFQSRQSKEMDSENAATSAPGPPANRPLRETGDFFFIRCGGEFAAKRRQSRGSSENQKKKLGTGFLLAFANKIKDNCPSNSSNGDEGWPLPNKFFSPVLLTFLDTLAKSSGFEFQDFRL